MKSSCKSSFSKRILVDLIDLTAFGIFIYLIKFVGINGVFYIPIYLLLATLFESVIGKSVGNLLTKSSILNRSSIQKQGFVNILFRNIISILTIPLFLFNFIWIIFTRNNQSWSDLLSNTVIVNDRYIDSFEKKANNTTDIIGKFSAILTASLTIIIVLSMLYYNGNVKPEYEKYLSVVSQSHEKNPESNGYYYLVGFDCSEDQSPFTVGYKAVENFVDLSFLSNMTTDQMENKLSHKGEIAKDTTNVPINATLEEIRSKQLEIEVYMDKYSYLEQRFLKLGEFTHFSNSEDRDAAPNHSLFNSGYSKYILLRNQRAKSLWLNGEYEESFNMFNSSLHVMHHILVNSPDNNTKVITATFISRVYQCINELYDLHDAGNQQLVDFISNAEYFTPEDFSYDLVLKDELKLSMLMFSSLYEFDTLDMFDNDGYNLDYLNKKHKMISFSYEFNRLCSKLEAKYAKWDQVEPMINLSSDIYMESIKNRKPEYDISTQGIFVYPVNLIGSLINNIMSQIGFSSTERLYTSNLAIASLKAKIEIESLALSEDQVQEFLVTNREKYKDPFTSEGLLFNPTSKTLESRAKLRTYISDIKLFSE